MYNSGYVMIDCGGLSLTDATSTVTGLYEKCKAAFESGKPIYACNCKYNGGAMSPIAVMMLLEDGIYRATASILQISVDDDDDVTVESLIS